MVTFLCNLKRIRRYYTYRIFKKLNAWNWKSECPLNNKAIYWISANIYAALTCTPHIFCIATLGDKNFHLRLAQRKSVLGFQLNIQMSPPVPSRSEQMLIHPVSTSAVEIYRRVHWLNPPQKAALRTSWPACLDSDLICPYINIFHSYLSVALAKLFHEIA